ncbi:MAG: response regulator [Gammaproteobacteria bacterium]|nr:response regulator [Gammaproteobacteria bacterium]MBU1818890.1 response regulator [Gammaproteobacteria bacterium]
MWESSRSAQVSPHDASASVRWLRLLALLSIGVPLFIYLIFGVVRYASARDDAQVRVSRTLRVAHEHTSKVIAASEALHDKVRVLVNGMSPVELRGNEIALHEALRALTVDQPQIQSILILDPQGKTVVSSRLQPFSVVDMSDGEYFQVHHHGKKGSHLSKPIVTRTSKERVLNLSVPFEDDKGKFGGVINVTLLTDYFTAYFGDMVADDPDLAVGLFREGGEIYTRWPDLGGMGDHFPPDGPVMHLLRSGDESGQVRGISSVTGQDSFLAYRKVGNYPLFVSTGISLVVLRDAVLKELALLFAIGALPVAALFMTATIALRNARIVLVTMARLEKETETRRRAEEALLQAQKLEALGRLTGGVAHDFNNALMVISNNLFLLKRQAPDVGTKQIDSMTRAVKSATNLTRQLLAFSRRQPLVAEHVILQEKLLPMTNLISPVLGSKVRLAVDVDPATAPVVLDLAELELALLNLSINARDAMPNGGSLHIRARNAARNEMGDDTVDMVVIEATDTGAGIAPELLNKVFEPFFTTKPVGEGTGLGLSQIYGMCERMGGRAAISSTVGSGTCISLYFPRAASKPTVEDAGPLPELEPLNKSVLLVEDNDEVAASIVPILESMGCRVTRVDRAANARQLLDQGSRPDLILSDVVMPGEMDGVALAKHVRQVWPDQRLLLMTGYAEQLDNITRMGFEVLPKPCTPQMLYAALVKASN